MSKEETLKSGAAIKLISGNMPSSPAVRLELIIELLGGQPVYDENDNDTGEVTPSFITLEDARKLLEIDDE